MPVFFILLTVILNAMGIGLTLPRPALIPYPTNSTLRAAGRKTRMSETHATAPEDRIPFLKKVAYGSGAFVNNLLASAIGGMMIVLNLGLGMNPALVGLLSALPRLTDAITDPLMGYISDNTRSRWGRRRRRATRGSSCTTGHAAAGGVIGDNPYR